MDVADEQANDEAFGRPGASRGNSAYPQFRFLGHGGNVGLKSRDPSDYQASILEVAGTSATLNEVLTMEGRWQSKLQSLAMGLNRNWAGQP